MHSTMLGTVILICTFTAYTQGTGERAEIISGPTDQVVAPGGVATFNCHARGANVYWYVDRRDPYPRQDYEARGFNFTYMEILHSMGELPEHNNTITVEARQSNNDTRIGCTARISNQHDFQEGTLIIAGPPLQPHVHILQEHDVNNNFIHHLNWSAPFTWDGFPITSYNVTVYNHSSGIATTLRKFVNDSELESLSIDSTSSGESCYMLDFYVSAANELGEGEPSVIRSGHPIVPAEIGDIETVVTFETNGTPHFWMSFNAPNICPGYQRGMYEISIYSDDGSGSLVHSFPPTLHSRENDEDEATIAKEMRTGLTYGVNYTVEVVHATLGIVHTKTKGFGTFLDEDFLYCSTDSISTSTLSPHSESLCSDSGQMALVVGVTAGAITLLLTLCVLSTCVLVCRRKKKLRQIAPSMPVVETDSALGNTAHCMKSKKTKPSNLRLQAQNPIYEGATYDSPLGENVNKCLLSPNSVPCTPLAESANRYVFDFPPKLPPPRKGSVSVPPKLETHKEIDTRKESMKNGKEVVSTTQQSGDEYMIMNAGITKPDTPAALSLSIPGPGNRLYTTIGKYGPEDEYVSVK